MGKRKISKRQNDRKLKKAVDQHMKELKGDEYYSNFSEKSNEASEIESVTFSPVSYENHSSPTYSSGTDSLIYSPSDNGSSSFSGSEYETKDKFLSTNAESVVNDTTKDRGLSFELRNCFLKHNVSHKFIDDMLEILGKYHDLPKDARTLLETPTSVASKFILGGEYMHFGIRSGIEEKVKIDLAESMQSLSLTFNIDGLPIYKSSSHQFWPILCLINELSYLGPFIVGIFCGYSKPKDLNEYLQDFVLEMQDLINNPKINGKTIDFTIRAFICDAPARSFLKCVKNHNGYYGCERCHQKGLWLKRTVFPEINSLKRKDEDFLVNCNNNKHITGRSPLLDIGIGLVTMFPLDYMHLVCLGVVRKLILAWCKGSYKVRLGSKAKCKLNENLLACSDFFPKEFQRQKQRSLNDVDRWKATEFRSFLLYTGPVALRGVLSDDIYNHFICLHVAMRILLSKNLSDSYLDYAEQLLVYFVSQCKRIYGAEFMVYNIHALVHLSDDVRRFGPLDTISAFPFESYLGKIKRLLRSPNKPLQQLGKRVIEKRKLSLVSPKLNKNTVSLLTPVISTAHSNGPDLSCNGIQYNEVKGSNFCLKTNSSDNCIMLKNGDILLCKNYICTSDDVLFIGQKFSKQRSFFKIPCKSSFLNIYKVSNLCPLSQWSSKDFLCKGIILPYKKEAVFLPLIHCFDNFF